MFENDLFAQRKQEQDHNRKFLIKAFFLIFLIFGTIAAVIGWRHVNQGWVFDFKSKGVKNDLTYETDFVRGRILMYLAQPKFSGKEFETQILGKAHLEVFQIDDREVYLSLPESENHPQKIQEHLKKLTLDPSKVEMAVDLGGIWEVGKYTLTKNQEKGVFFKTASKNIRFEPQKLLHFPFKTGDYTMSLKEMADFMDNKSVYGGYLRADTQLKTEDGKFIFFYNHGAFVAKPKEPSLKRLVETLTKDIAPTDELAREKRIQRVLDFVTSEIQYDETEALSNVETLKHPNEILMTRRGDCSNKAILLGSFLEQMGEDYLFLYCSHHITVGVKPGKFPTTNNLTFTWEGKPWLIAEPTATGFHIGQDHLKKETILKNVQFVQRPNLSNIIFDAYTTQLLKFW